MLCVVDSVVAREGDTVAVTDDDPLERGEELTRRLPLDDTLRCGLLLELGEPLGEPDADLDAASLREAAALIETLAEPLADAAADADRVAAGAVCETVGQDVWLGDREPDVPVDNEAPTVRVGGAPLGHAVLDSDAGAFVCDTRMDRDAPDETDTAADTDAATLAVMDTDVVALWLTGSVSVLYGVIDALGESDDVAQEDAEKVPVTDALQVLDVLATLVLDAEIEADDVLQLDSVVNNVVVMVDEVDAVCVMLKLPVAMIDGVDIRLAVRQPDRVKDEVPVALGLPLTLDARDSDETVEGDDTDESELQSVALDRAEPEPDRDADALRLPLAENEGDKLALTVPLGDNDSRDVGVDEGHRE